MRDAVIINFQIIFVLRKFWSETRKKMEKQYL